MVGEEEEEDYHPTRHDEIKRKYGEQRCAMLDVPVCREREQSCWVSCM